MTDQSQHQGTTGPASEPITTDRGVPVTGNPAVDRILADVASVGERPLTGHVAAFEHAHEGLRSALDSPRN